MKRPFIRFLLVAVVISFPSPVRAAAENGREIAALGLVFGPTFANADFTPAQSTTARLGLVAGADLELRIWGDFFVRSGLSYVPYGYDQSNVKDGVSGSVTAVTVPMLLEFKTPVAGAALKVFANFGPSVAIRLTATSVSNNEVTDQTSAIAPTAVGLSLGVGIDYDLGSNFRGLLETRYCRGVTNFMADNSQTIYNRDLQWLLGFRYNL